MSTICWKQFKDGGGSGWCYSPLSISSATYSRDKIACMCVWKVKQKLKFNFSADLTPRLWWSIRIVNELNHVCLLIVLLCVYVCVCVSTKKWSGLNSLLSFLKTHRMPNASMCGPVIFVPRAIALIELQQTKPARKVEHVWKTEIIITLRYRSIYTFICERSLCDAKGKSDHRIAI